MKASKVVLGLAFCLFAALASRGDVVTNGEAVTKFASESLGITLTDYPFGKDISRDKQFTQIKPSYNFVDAKLTWYSGPASAKYSQEHPRADLVYDVQNDKVTTIIVITMLSPGVNAGEMRKIREEIIRLRAFDLDDGHYHIRYHAECGPRTEDPLVSSAVTITPSEKKK